MSDDVIACVHLIARQQKANPGLVFGDRNNVPNNPLEAYDDDEEDDDNFVPDEESEGDVDEDLGDEDDAETNGDDEYTVFDDDDNDENFFPGGFLRGVRSTGVPSRGVQHTETTSIGVPSTGVPNTVMSDTKARDLIPHDTCSEQDTDDSNDNKSDISHITPGEPSGVSPAQESPMSQDEPSTGASDVNISESPNKAAAGGAIVTLDEQYCPRTNRYNLRECMDCSLFNKHGHGYVNTMSGRPGTRT